MDIRLPFIRDLNLKAKRLFLGLPIRKVERITGVSRSAICRIENGNGKVEYENVKALFDFYADELVRLRVIWPVDEPKK